MSTISNSFRITEFTTTPGGRYKDDGKYSGEEFRDNYLIPLLLNSHQHVLIDLDGAFGFPSSFLEEAFGGLARLYPANDILQKFIFKIEDEPRLKMTIIKYIVNARGSN